MKPLIFFSLVVILFVGACKPSVNDPGNDTTNEVALKDTICVDSAKKLVKNFEPRIYRPRIGFYDTRCVWFSIKQLKPLIDQIIKDSGDGVRFYLAAYDQNSSSFCEDKYRDHTTLIMVSTRDSIINRGNKCDTLHFDYFEGKTPKMRGAILTTTPENRGEMCPPPSNCISEGALLFQP